MCLTAPVTEKTRERKLLMLVLAVVLMTVPGLILTAMGLNSLVSVWSMGSIAGFVALMSGGPRVAAVVVPALLVLMPVASWWSGSPWLGGAILTVAAVAAAYPARWSRNTGTNWALITLAFAVADPPDLGHAWTAGDYLLIGAVAALAALWGIGMAAAGGSRGPTTPSEGVGPNRALAFALIKAATIGATGWAVIDLNLGLAGAWMIMTVILVVQPSFGDTWSRTLQRAAGTFAGFVLAFVVGVVIPWGVVVYLVGTLFLVAALVLRTKGVTYWRYVTFMTPSVVLMEGANGAVISTDFERLGATLVGVAISLGVVAIMRPLHQAIGPAKPEPSSGQSS